MSAEELPFPDDGEVAVDFLKGGDTTSSAVVGVSTSFLMLATSAGSIIGASVMMI